LTDKDIISKEPYNLLPKDNKEQKNGYTKYFEMTRTKMLEELKIDSDDKLFGESKFILFIAFDIMDSKPSFEDLIGIDPLNDYKKYKLNINTNNRSDLFFVSGQIVYIEGNLIEDGKVIEVNSFRSGYKIDEYTIKYEEISPFYQKSSDPYALYYMNGPYFFKDNTDASVFRDVLKQVAKKDPHIFLINGPFFSTDNEKVKFGEIDTEQGMIDIINLIKDEFKSTRTKILICPGISDNENFYPLPQPAFDKINDTFLHLDKIISSNSEIIFISNPQIISLNEAFIGIANFDTIKDIILNSVHSPEIDTVNKACEMILYQKNFYPLLPNTLQTRNENDQEKIATVDLSQYNYLNFESYCDIVLTNSAMKSFARRNHGTVFVNCGSFIKNKGYGEIAKLTLHSPSKETDINKRVKVEFIKINAGVNNTNTNKKK
jgi:hypothetical protein